MNQEIKWKHVNGKDEIITNVTGNTYIGEIANKFMTGVTKSFRNNDDINNSYDNILLNKLFNSSDWIRHEQS